MRIEHETDDCRHPPDDLAFVSDQSKLSALSDSTARASRRRGRELILAGDIGATKTRLGPFAGHDASPSFSATYITADFESPTQLVSSFSDRSTCDRPAPLSA